MGAARHLLSCSTCGQDFELPESCPDCLCLRPSRTNTPVCPAYESQIISVRGGAIPPPPSVPVVDADDLDKIHTRISELKGDLRRRLERATLTRGMIFGAVLGMTLLRILDALR